MVEISQNVRDIIIWIGLGFIGLGALLIGLGLADIDDNTIFLIILACGLRGDASIITLILFAMYSPGIATAGVVLAIIGSIIILIFRIIAMTSEEIEDSSLIIFEWFAIVLGMVGGIMGAVCIGQWTKLRITLLIIGLAAGGEPEKDAPAYIAVGLLVYMGKPALLAILATVVTIGGMAILMVPKLIKLKQT